MRRTTALLAAALTLGLLAGCDTDGDGYDDQTGKPVAAAGTTGGENGDCVGWGPLSGCDDTDGSPTRDATSEDASSSECSPNGWGPLACGDNDDSPSRGEDGGFEPDPGVTHAQLFLVAVHEAGHKAVADEYGWSAYSVRIHPDGSGKAPVWGLRWKDPQQQLTLYYAGAIACGDETTGYGDSDTKGDYDYAEDILDRYPPDEANRMEAAARAEAQRIVTARADQIDADAADLLADGRLG